MVNLIVAVILELIPHAKVGVYADEIRDPQAVAYALSWVQEERPVLVTERYPGEVIQIAKEIYCIDVQWARGRQKTVTYDAASDGVGKLVRFYKKARKGRRVYLAGVEDVAPATVIARLLRAQFYISAGDEGGWLSLDAVQRTCE